MISGHGNIQTAVEAIKIGAYDFIEKPFKTDRLVLQVRHALDAARLRRENQELKFRAGSRLRSDRQVGGPQSGAPDHRARGADRQPRDDHGPGGRRQGNRRARNARPIHRAAGAFVVINCTVTQPDLWKSNCSAPSIRSHGGSRKIGAFEQAHGGTLYLDEVDDMPPETQGKIVRVLQEQAFTRVGGNTRVEVDVRVVAASSSDLLADMQIGRVRQDLYYRLSVVPIKIPALTERARIFPCWQPIS